MLATLSEVRDKVLTNHAGLLMIVLFLTIADWSIRLDLS